MSQQDFRCKTAADAVAWLKQQGWKASPAQFSRHAAAGHVPRDADGMYGGASLRAYAAAHLQPLARSTDKEARSAAMGKLSADAELKAVKAERERLKLDKERGRLMPVADYEAELAARAMFFRSEILSFAHRKAAEIIRVTQGKEETLDALLAWWEDATLDWMDSWSADRDFVINSDDQEEETFEPDDREEA